MRHAAVIAGLLPKGSAYSLLWELETDVLDSLPPWMTRLFLHLVRISDFASGAGSTSYQQLVDLMARTIQPARGPRHFVPDVQAVKKAVEAFEERRILARDKRASEGARLLFFVVHNRRAEVRPPEKLDPLTRPRVDNRKRRPGAGSRPMA